MRYLKPPPAAAALVWRKCCARIAARIKTALRSPRGQFFPRLFDQDPAFPVQQVSVHTPLKIGILEGDDIGLEVVPETIKVMRAAAKKSGVDIDWHAVPIGRKALDELGNTLPPGTLEKLDTLDGWVLGPIGHQAYPKGNPNSINPHPILRKHFDLFANIRPAKSYPGLPALHKDVDLVIVRENNEGMPPDRNVYMGNGEFRPTPDMTIGVRVITRQGSRKVARAAFDFARTRPRKKVTAVHKDTVFKLACGMFAEECRAVAKDFPDITYDEVLVDTFAMKLVMKPQQFDVIVTTNTFGDILSDEAAGLVGGLGLAPGLSAGPNRAMAQATHGSAPDIAGKGIANPYAMIMSGQMLMAWLGHKHGQPKAVHAAQLIERAMESVIRGGSVLTPDLGGKASTREMGDAVAAAVGSA
jgi:3-isopropylmalate dehydrogenase